MLEVVGRAEAATRHVPERAEGRGLEVIQAIEAGRPQAEIVRYAESNDVDVVVMGPADRGGVRRAVLGSVAERTRRTSKIPVLVVGVRGD